MAKKIVRCVYIIITEDPELATPVKRLCDESARAYSITTKYFREGETEPCQIQREEFKAP